MSKKLSLKEELSLIKNKIKLLEYYEETPQELEDKDKSGLISYPLTENKDVWDENNIRIFLDTIGQDEMRFRSPSRGVSHGDYGTVKFDVQWNTLYLVFDHLSDMNFIQNKLSSAVTNPYEIASRFDEMPHTLMIQFTPNDSSLDENEDEAFGVKKDLDSLRRSSGNIHNKYFSIGKELGAKADSKDDLIALVTSFMRKNNLNNSDIYTNLMDIGMSVIKNKSFNEDLGFGQYGDAMGLDQTSQESESIDSDTLELLASKVGVFSKELKGQLLDLNKSGRSLTTIQIHKILNKRFTDEEIDVLIFDAEHSQHHMNEQIKGNEGLISPNSPDLQLLCKYLNLETSDLKPYITNMHKGEGYYLKDYSKAQWTEDEVINVKNIFDVVNSQTNDVTFKFIRCADEEWQKEDNNKFTPAHIIFMVIPKEEIKEYFDEVGMSSSYGSETVDNNFKENKTMKGSLEEQVNRYKKIMGIKPKETISESLEEGKSFKDNKDKKDQEKKSPHKSREEKYKEKYQPWKKGKESEEDEEESEMDEEQNLKPIKNASTKFIKNGLKEETVEENEEIKQNFNKEYGKKKGDSIYYATAKKQERNPKSFMKMLTKEDILKDAQTL